MKELKEDGSNLPIKDPKTGRDLFTNGKVFRYMGDLEAANQATTEMVPGEKSPRKLAPWVRVTDQKLVVPGHFVDGGVDTGVRQDAVSQALGVRPIHTVLEELRAAKTVADVEAIVKDEARTAIVRAGVARSAEIVAGTEEKPKTVKGVASKRKTAAKLKAAKVKKAVAAVEGAANGDSDDAKK